MENIFLVTISLPAIFGLFCLIVPKKLKGLREGFALIGSLATFLFTIRLFLSKTEQTAGLPWFYLDNLSGFILPAIGLFGVLIVLYSLKFMAGNERLNEYYAYTLWTISSSSGVILANNLILLLAFWSFLGLTLYLLIGIGGHAASDAAKKTLVIVGISDALMLFGVGALWSLAGSFEMNKINVEIASFLSLAGCAFIALLISAFTKAGAMPFHTWIPDMAEKAPLPVTAFLPASLDKLLGIYLLVRICMNLFIMSKGMGFILLLIGAGTIICAVMMALIQHDLKRLLSYHAVSQVGYMVLGIGTGNPIGIAGGIFHMLNNAIYKECLFLTGGAVEYRTKTTDLDKLGGLAKSMPITFITCLIAALSISGVPPFNGFVSKWMIYQGIIQLRVHSSEFIANTWWIFLIAAMFGSALTLASFMKLIHTTFLGQSSNVARGFSLANNSDPLGSHYNESTFLGQRNNAITQQRINEVSWTMSLPQIVLAGLCVLFGIFAFQIPLKYFIIPALNLSISQSLNLFLGLWQPGLATGLIIVGLIIGVVIYLISKAKIRESSVFIGGEALPDEVRVTGVDFYQTIRDTGFFKQMYNLAEKKYFDIYDWGKAIVFGIFRPVSDAHSGLLPTYLIWFLVGFLVLLFVGMR